MSDANIEIDVGPFTAEQARQVGEAIARQVAKNLARKIVSQIAQVFPPQPRPCSECRQEETCRRISYCAAYRCGFGEDDQP